MDGLIIFARRH